MQWRPQHGVAFGYVNQSRTLGADLTWQAGLQVARVHGSVRLHPMHARNRDTAITGLRAIKGRSAPAGVVVLLHGRWREGQVVGRHLVCAPSRELGVASVAHDVPWLGRSSACGRGTAVHELAVDVEGHVAGALGSDEVVPAVPDRGGSAAGIERRAAETVVEVAAPVVGQDPAGAAVGGAIAHEGDAALPVEPALDGPGGGEGGTGRLHLAVDAVKADRGVRIPG